MYNENVETDLYLLLVIGTKSVGKGLLTKRIANISYSCLKQRKNVQLLTDIK